MKEQGQVDAIKDGFYRMRNFPGVIDAWIGPQLDHHLTVQGSSPYNSDVDYEPMESDNETIDSYESDDVDLSEHEDDGVMLSDSWKRIAVIFVTSGLSIKSKTKLFENSAFWICVISFIEDDTNIDLTLKNNIPKITEILHLNRRNVSAFVRKIRNIKRKFEKKNNSSVLESIVIEELKYIIGPE
ncbi:hypothetical protein GQR58_024745 [Nymphon striatum]|nr:hypothetical protein GQR58_024745 [Nymphon striatum]